MATASLTRRVTFSAAHRYRRPDWSDEENARVFGGSANAHYHGHSYRCDVTISGPVDPDTGMVIDLGLLDRALSIEIKQRFDQRNINKEVPEFNDGMLIPTGENLARFIAERVQQAIGDAARVTRVVLAEDDTLWAEFPAR
ncbi:MAG: 6-pyruvoyl trahydropterin synthase family protein [Gemmatimonadaceae bacterium]